MMGVYMSPLELRRVAHEFEMAAKNHLRPDRCLFWAREARTRAQHRELLGLGEDLDG